MGKTVKKMIAVILSLTMLFTTQSISYANLYVVEKEPAISLEKSFSDDKLLNVEDLYINNLQENFEDFDMDDVATDSNADLDIMSLSVYAAGLDYSGFYARLEQIKEVYPEGRWWNNNNHWPNGGFAGCFAFANIMCQDVFGT